MPCLRPRLPFVLLVLACVLALAAAACTNDPDLGDAADTVAEFEECLGRSGVDPGQLAVRVNADGSIDSIEYDVPAEPGRAPSAHQECAAQLDHGLGDP